MKRPTAKSSGTFVAGPSGLLVLISFKELVAFLSEGFILPMTCIHHTVALSTDAALERVQFGLKAEDWRREQLLSPKMLFIYAWLYICLPMDNPWC